MPNLNEIRDCMQKTNSFLRSVRAELVHINESLIGPMPQKAEEASPESPIPSGILNTYQEILENQEKFTIAVQKQLDDLATNLGFRELAELMREDR